MKQRMVAICAVAVAIVLWSLPAAAGKPFNESSLSGTYAFSFALVRGTGADVAYCSGYGTMTFDGIDEVVEVVSFEFCSDDQELKDETQTYPYSVADEPYFFIGEPGAGSTHCQLVQRGNVIMCDGTTRADETASFHAVAFKQ